MLNRHRSPGLPGTLMVNSISADILARRQAPGSSVASPAFLVLDTESVPDGRLIAKVKYPNEGLSPEEAIRRAQEEARVLARDGSDFLPVTFHYPIAVCVLRVGPDFGLQALTCLDAPQFRPAEIVRAFWKGMAAYRAKLVTFNGRGFDLPLLELAAFRYGCSAGDYFQSNRNRFNGNHLDLLDWLSNYGACRLAGGLDLLSKILGKPGKMEVSGDRVYALYQEGKLQQINDYCAFDTLDTYFVFLRTRVLFGEMTLQEEGAVVQRAREWLTAKVPEMPALARYLENWGEWQPWP
jgi:predicted PolB exonuclease-like 3'-5' exonuclease